MKGLLSILEFIFLSGYTSIIALVLVLLSLHVESSSSIRPSFLSPGKGYARKTSLPPQNYFFKV